MGTAACDILGNLVIGDLREQCILAEPLDQVVELVFGGPGGRLVFSDFDEIAAGGGVQRHRLALANTTSRGRIVPALRLD